MFEDNTIYNLLSMSYHRQKTFEHLSVTKKYNE
jgi:hypothetical protein